MTGRIAFSADREQDGRKEIYIVEAPWEQAERVASTDRDQPMCDWYGPSDEVLFESHAASDDQPRLYRIGADGGDLLPLIPSDMQGAQADWSPDGSQVAFVGWLDGSQDLFVVNADGSGLQRLASTEADEASPDWSPDTKSLVFVSNSDGNEVIYRMEPDGSGAERLTSSPAREGEPAWSPLGGTIALVRWGEGESQIWLVSLDDATETLLVKADDVDSLAWSPDGRLLAFVADVGEESGVFILQIASGERLRLPTSTGEERGLTWVP